MTIGERIKIRRKELNLTQEELATRMGYKSRTAISNVEKDLEDLTTTRVAKYAKALECTPGYLMGWTDNPNQESLTEKLESNHLNPKLVTKYDIDNVITLTEEEHKILECYRELDGSQKEMLKRMINYYDHIKEV